MSESGIRKSALAGLPRKQQRGSFPRCLVLTEGADDVVARRLMALVEPFAVIDGTRHVWMPRGFSAPAEAKLGESGTFLSDHHRREVRAWWLAIRRGNTNTPNWDIASTATIEGREGLVLVEAKGHANELHAGGKKFQASGRQPSSPENHEQIGVAIAEGQAALCTIMPGFTVSRDSHYQLANRFAWAWKLASLGIPVLLIYLGFLNANEMRDRGPPFSDADEWEQVLRRHARGIIPDAAWSEPLLVDGTPVRAIIRAVEVDLPS